MRFSKFTALITKHKMERLFILAFAFFWPLVFYSYFGLQFNDPKLFLLIVGSVGKYCSYSKITFFEFLFKVCFKLLIFYILHLFLMKTLSQEIWRSINVLENTMLKELCEGTMKSLDILFGYAALIS